MPRITGSRKSYAGRAWQVGALAVLRSATSWCLAQAATRVTGRRVVKSTSTVIRLHSRDLRCPGHLHASRALEVPGSHVCAATVGRRCITRELGASATVRPIGHRRASSNNRTGSAHCLSQPNTSYALEADTDQKRVERRAEMMLRTRQRAHMIEYTRSTEMSDPDFCAS